MPNLSRRRALSLIAVTVAGGTLMSRQAFAQDAPAASGLINGADVCAITPETTEGPYYFDPALVRTDITEGRPGLATRLRLQVVDTQCRPIPEARVDIWHCDAEGIYSGYTGQPGGLDTSGATFMRGTQFADANGIVEFDTVYPGWYPGRTPHIHFKVFPDETSAMTGQIFFPDEVSDTVYSAVAPYNSRSAEGRTGNERDGIARQAGAAAVASVESLPEAYIVQMIIGVA
jgi:protocatechuate 3,4-dioxygenase beta subunit